MHSETKIDGLRAQVGMLVPVRTVGRVARVQAGVIEIKGMASDTRIGDRIRIARDGQPPLEGEIIQLQSTHALVLPEAPPQGIALDDRASVVAPHAISPCDSWLGRIIDPAGAALDGQPLMQGAVVRPLHRAPPAPAARRALGARLSTGMALTNTFLPVVAGQRIGLFAGSGVGKSSLLGMFATHVHAEVVVIALIGERGRELRHFVEDVIGADGMKRCVIVAATSDRSALERRRCVWTAMAVAEHFRDAGRSVLLLADSITRFAEAHREVAVAAGEAPVLRGYPPSTASTIMSLCERAGPGQDQQGDITAVLSVLVAGSDMDEPIADMLRGVLDGHIVLDRSIAERGRYPAIDILRSVSRSLPAAATKKENDLLGEARRLLGLYDRNAVMIRAGLYTQGSDPELDQAVAIWPELEKFAAQTAHRDCAHSFQQLELILRRGRTSPGTALRPAAQAGTG